MSQKLSKQFVYLNFNQTIFHEYDADFYENFSPGRETNHFGHKNIYHIILVMKHIRIGFVNNVIIISETFLFFQGSQQMHQQQQQSAGSFMQKSTSSSTSSSSATTQVKSILKQPQQQIRQHGEEIGQEKLKTQIQSAITDIEDNIDRRDFADKENMSPTQQQQQQQQMMFQQQQQQVDI